MFWVDRLGADITEKLHTRIASGEPLLIRDEKTASGRVHVGSMRALALHAAIAERLTEEGIANVFRYEINDMDPMDGLPVYLDAAIYEKEMGKPLFSIPSPDGVAKNFAEYFAEEYIAAIHEAGFTPELYRASELYFSGRMNDAIRLVLEHAATIRTIYKEVSGAERPDDWFPLSVICESCGKVGTTKVTSFDGERVTYTCGDFVTWARGCGHTGSVSPFDGKAKLPWKVEWPAKWFVLGVDIEGGGKDHYSKGGARDVARAIAKEVFRYPEPFGVPNEFFLVGGKKMSSSKGQGAAAKEIVELVPPYIFRLALFGKDVNQQINFDPAGDTIPVLFDTYDRLAEKYVAGAHDDQARLFEFLHPLAERGRLEPMFHVRFSQVVFLVQMPHLDNRVEAERLKGSALTPAEAADLEERARYAMKWLATYAPESQRFVLQEEKLPESVHSFSPEQKRALAAVRAYVEAHESLDGQELHTALHEIRKESGLEAGLFFGALYQSFLGKESGPKAGWFLSVLHRDFLLARLEAAAG